MFYESLLAFKYRVNSFPTKMFVFTNCGREAEEEVQHFRTILSKLKMSNVKLVMMQVDSEIKTHFFNIESGTRFNSAKTGYVIPKNDPLKVLHSNEDLSLSQS